MRRKVKLSFILGVVGGIFVILVALLYTLSTSVIPYGFLIAGIVGIAGAAVGKKLGGALMIIAGVSALILGGFLYGILPLILLLAGGIIALREKVVVPTLPIIAGILTIIASCMSLLLGIFGVISVYVYFEYVGVYGILAFAFGLTAAILSLKSGLTAGKLILKKKIFGLSMVGVSLLIVSGILFSVPLDGNSVWEIGLAIAILSILSIVFIAKAWKTVE